jgi:hypothetical protein
MNGDFDMDEIFGYLLEDNNLAVTYSCTIDLRKKSWVLGSYTPSEFRPRRALPEIVHLQVRLLYNRRERSYPNALPEGR